MKTLSSPLKDALQAVDQLDLEGLRAYWRQRWGSPPRLRSRELLAYAAAYRLQTDALGDLPAPTRRRIAELGRRFAADRKYQPSVGPKLTPGCSLVREWGGARHEVQVLETGFGYLGKRFTSLSQVAEHITGAKRSGILFFGLKDKAQGA